ncbi:hypothetical protein [Streptomyces sp. C]|uniref:hypothetical protein n=1 Tax=Streptomyces sp. C TaxID=253839 RepID=UPI0001B4F278|nr:hypothetical protein [Streptomyces sp. C]EFL19884.1 predicted protein [Streptomyces sp. C]
MSELLLEDNTEKAVFDALLVGTPRENVEFLVARRDSLTELFRRVRARHGIPLRCVALGAVVTGQLDCPAKKEFRLSRQLDERTVKALHAWIEHTGYGLPKIEPDTTPVELAKILRTVHQAFRLPLTVPEVTLVGATLAHGLVGVEQWENLRGTAR